MMATIKDVATEAGVSVTAVSRILNDPKYGSERARTSVFTAVKKLGYQPNNIARSMVQGKTRMIALVIPVVRNSFFTDVARGVEDVAHKYGYRVMLCNTDEDEIKQQSYLEALRGKIIDGFIIAAASDEDRDLKKIDRSQLPFVLIDRQPPGVTADAVVVDNRDGAYKATEYLLNLGHRQIGIITGRNDTLPGRERLRGYREALTAAGIAPVEALTRDGRFTREGGYEAAQAILNAPVQATAIFASNNAMTHGCLKALVAAGIKIPRQMAVVGFDDADWAELFTPPLTVIRQPTYTMGTLAGEILFQRLGETTPSERKEIVLKPELVIRESCGAK